jgi:hypothetical protein
MCGIVKRNKHLPVRMADYIVAFAHKANAAELGAILERNRMKVGGWGEGVLFSLH